MWFKGRGGSILIITLWILAILTVLSVGVAGRMGLELKLTGFHRDDMKALYLARAGIERVIAEKVNDDTPEADILNEPWANDEGLFNDYKISEMENASYTIKYTYKETRDGDGIQLYGMLDEASKININKVVEDEELKNKLISLLEIVCDLSNADATAKVNALVDWMDGDTVAEGGGDENAVYYSDVGAGNYCKNRLLESVEELLLVKGFDSDILYGDKEQGKYGIIDYITIYTEDGKVNVNTAPKEVLQALGFNGDYEHLADGIITYRTGGGDPGGPENQSINLSELGQQSSNPIFGGRDLDDNEFGVIQSVIPYLSEASTTFRINAYGKVNRVEKHIECVVTLGNGNYKIKYWNED